MERENKEQFEFEGFYSPNYTPVPDVVFDRLLKRLSGAEMKVLFYIIRRTFGFKKMSDDISFSQICTGISTRDGRVLDEGTGLSKSTAQIAIKGLVAKKIIIALRKKNAAGGNEATSYTLHFRAGANDPYTDNRHRGGMEIGTGVYRKSATQETVIQDNVNVAFKKAEQDFDRGDGQPPAEPIEVAMRSHALVKDILATFPKDQKSTAFYHKIARLLPEEAIRADLKTVSYDTMLDPNGKGHVRNPAAVFTNRLKETAKRLGVQL